MCVYIHMYRHASAANATWIVHYEFATTFFGIIFGNVHFHGPILGISPLSLIFNTSLETLRSIHVACSKSLSFHFYVYVYV